MSARQRVILFLILLGLVLTGLLIYFYMEGQKQTNWSINFDSDSDQPYGTSVIRKLIERASGRHDFILLEEALHEALPRNAGAGAGYVHIGMGTYYDSLDLDALLAFVEAGHTAFLSSRYLPYKLLDTLLPTGLCADLMPGDYPHHSAFRVYLQLTQQDAQTYEYHVRGRSDTLLYYWDCLYHAGYCDPPAGLLPLGTLDTILVNFARIPFGEGTFLLHTTPIAFTNFALLEESHFEYARRVLSYLPEGPVYWDRQREQTRPFPPRNQRYSARSPLQYVLGQPPLAWAWYLMLALGLLYVLFQSKRRQRIVPVLEKNTNTSLEFVSTIGRLYFMQQNHGQLCRQKTRLFQSFISRRYGLPARSLRDPVERHRLAQMSEIPQEEIERIATLAQNIEGAAQVSERTLEEYHHLLDHFYKNCK
jgi:hypothetical protein